MSYKKYRWQEIIDNGGMNSLMRSLGCPNPSSYKYFGCSTYRAGLGVKAWQRQPCLKVQTRLRAHAERKYGCVRHFMLDGDCETGTEVLCVREKDPFAFEDHTNIIVTTHEKGNCPLCVYKKD
jgi:hypothetical protein